MAGSAINRPRPVTWPSSAGMAPLAALATSAGPVVLASLAVLAGPATLASLAPAVGLAARVLPRAPRSPLVPVPAEVRSA